MYISAIIAGILKWLRALIISENQELMAKKIYIHKNHLFSQWCEVSGVMWTDFTLYQHDAWILQAQKQMLQNRGEFLNFRQRTYFGMHPKTLELRLKLSRILGPEFKHLNSQHRDHLLYVTNKFTAAKYSESVVRQFVEPFPMISVSLDFNK